MNQSDLDLLQTVPTYHLGSVIKTRHIPFPQINSNKTSLTINSTSLALAPETMQELANYLFDPVSIVNALQGLGDFEAAILRELVACGGRANSRDLALFLTYAGLLTPAKKPGSTSFDPPPTPPTLPLQPPQYPPAHAHGVFEMALRRLLTFGLVFWGKQTNFAGRDYTNGTPDGMLIVPIAVRAVVQQEWLLNADDIIEEQSANISDGARNLQRALYLYWSLVSSMRDGLPLVTTGLLARSALRHIVEHMPMQEQKDQVRTESALPFLLFVRLLLMQLGLLQERQQSLYAAPAEAYFSLSLIERARCCYRLYFDTPFWNEILHLAEVNVRPGPAQLDPAHEEVVRARQAVIERLRFEQIGVWQDIATFIAHTKLYVPYLLFPHQFGSRAERYSYGSNLYGWDFRLRRGWLTHREGWHMIEGGFIRAVIGGPLHWLGLLELTFDGEENPTAFRLSPGTRVLMSTTFLETSQETWGRLIIQPNFELVVLAPVSEALLVKLDRFADRIRLEHIAQYRLSKSSVMRAISYGLHAEDMLEVLEHASGTEIPQNVRYSLVEWERQARRIELWPNSTLLEVDNEAMLDTLFADEQTRTLFRRRLAPRMAEVNPNHLGAVQELLWQQNYLPALSSVSILQMAHKDATMSHEPQWQLDNEGRLLPCYAVPDLYLVAEVEGFCERDEATSHYKITAASVHHALEQGIAFASIMRFLQQYCDGGIPAALLIRLKLWGNGYGNKQNIQVERAPLLCLTEELLHDFKADEELGPLLGPEVEQQSRLVRVDSDNLEQVLTLLRERGFSIE